MESPITLGNNNNQRNIAVLNFGTNDRSNCVTVLETALYLTEKYIGKIINSSYIYETVPEYVVLDETIRFEKVREKEIVYDINWVNDLVTTLERSRHEEGDDLIYECKELEKFLKNEKLNESTIQEVSVEKYEYETKNIIRANDEIMKKNLEQFKNKYYTSYFFNLTVIVRSFVEDPLSMLIILKYIEQIMKRKDAKKDLGEIFENRIIDIDILFFNNYTIFEKCINLKKEDVYKIITKYIHIDNNTNKKRLEIIQNLNDKIKFLCIPHVYTKRRYSILLCLNDIIPDYIHSTLNESINSAYNNYINKFEKIHCVNIRKNNKRLYVLKDKVSHLKEKTHIVGILNVNYDSFSDGGLFVNPTKAVERMFEMINDGASVIDIGGESSAPYVVPNPNITERDLVIPVLKLFKKEWNKLVYDMTNNVMDSQGEENMALQNMMNTKPIISIDTVNYDIFKECVDLDVVDILNDISSCTHNPDIIKLLKKKNKFYTVVLMHKRGNPHTMDKLTNYNDLIYDIKNYLKDRLNFLVLNGIPRYRILFDVGLGFAKKHDQSIKLLQHIHVYDEYPLFLGYSRKRFIAHCMEKNGTTNGHIKLSNGNKNEDKKDTSQIWRFKMNYMRQDKDQLLYQKNICGGLAIASYSFYKKVDLIRVHDVLETKAVLDVLTKIHQS
ncbi:hydroxymethylpterin pyrophosphokinase-dihydropteroate synthetase [Plasmodium gonderi]|uniref:2-amino-4-hydroxy-6-hydroxymethyldihydropteridine diphosphokinase n=1 Tax=Plasmodium gonderi TaxID=77519 RepID=A0A1Y1JMM1_PLAGO|nr:hydroxymethylpterin pyrophosphokinase-dihydropteroate synthetase [Plasmodium gonderi]GAW83490.1 hydroxymethylpterin pyrophosphokinase-dihydropteroate synthetase [Plasmodium gonderi]